MICFKKILYLFIIGLTILNEGESYVLVQVRKGDKKPNTDTLIHRVVPSHKFDEIADTARKQFKNFNQFKIKTKPDDKELDSIVFAIKPEENANGDRRQYGADSDSARNVMSGLVGKTFGLFKKPDDDDFPNLRAKLKKYNIKPEIIQFKNNNGKPSIMYEIDTKSILHTIKEILSSRMFKVYTDNIIKKAAVIYRTFKEELDQE
ncbi:uncharacterized protein LOC124542114 [Vanessa cardui]|uniref:uncharacterized protein LOC124542114 n=1 Tax=Vanessa cardui TaxID=171605 RepID=UPI001F12F905|nr:uncharacterized protein LOC124542114 [Vanessa cardui]